MSWLVDSSYSWLQRICINIIKAGAVPKHVAFIMDGNRRFAKKINVEKADGHSKGFNKLAETLVWCLDLGIPEVTVYAFSIENFKRSKEEVNTLMRLATEKFEQLLYKERDKLMEYGVRVRVIGNLLLLDDRLKSLIAELMLLTNDNNKALLNIAFAYTAREEICTGVREAMGGVERGELLPEDVDERLLDRCLYGTSEPEIIVRTSGEVRLSDFQLWQAAGAQMHFARVLWPEFSLWHLLATVFIFQRKRASLIPLHEAQARLLPPPDVERERRTRLFLDHLQQRRMEQLHSFLRTPDTIPVAAT